MTKVATPPLIDFRTFKIEVRAKSPEGLPTEVEGRVLTYNKVDAYGTRWKKGSIVESVQNRLPPFLWAHSVTEPIGRASDFSDHKDHFRMLFRLDDPNFVPRARQAAYQIKEGTIDEFSIGFTRVETKYLDPDKEKDQAWEEMIKANVVETSIVPYGAVPETGVVGMRALYLPEDMVAKLKIDDQPLREVIRVRSPEGENGNPSNGGNNGEPSKTETSEETTTTETKETKETVETNPQGTSESGTEGDEENGTSGGTTTDPKPDDETNPEAGTSNPEERSPHTFVRKVTDGTKTIKVVEATHEEGSLSSIMENRRLAREAKEEAARQAESLRIAEVKQKKEADEADELAQRALAMRNRNDYMSSIRGRRR